MTIEEYLATAIKLEAEALNLRSIGDIHAARAKIMEAYAFLEMAMEMEGKDQ